MTYSITHLNEALFAQLGRLQKPVMGRAELDQEVTRAKAIIGVSEQITTVAGMQLAAAALIAKHGDRHAINLPMIEAIAPAVPSPTAASDRAPEAASEAASQASVKPPLIAASEGPVTSVPEKNARWLFATSESARPEAVRPEECDRRFLAITDKAAPEAASQASVKPPVDKNFRWKDNPPPRVSAQKGAV